MSQEGISNRFTYHAPDQDKIYLHGQVRESLLTVANYFDDVLPDGREKALALTKLEEAMFWSNAAIARN